MKMNKKILAAACGLLVSGVVCADDMKFYVGGDLGYNKLGYSSTFKSKMDNSGIKAKSKSPAATLVLGVRTHENFGAEVGYTFYKKVKTTDKTTNADVSNLKMNDMHVALLGYMPINSCFDVIGSFGAGRLSTKETDVGASAVKNSIGTLNFGAGVQYNFDEHFSTRAMLGYSVVGTKIQGIKNMKTFKVGVTYTI